MFRALIADDEPLARRTIVRFLQQHREFEIAGECGNGEDTARAILTQKPDVLFLDVQMPEMNGFDVFTRVGVEQMPVTIFVTAYDQYAVRAFDCNAVDYLLKPFSQDRFNQAVTRAKERVAGRQNDVAKLVAALEQLRTRTEWVERIPVIEKGRVILVNTSQIHWIEAEGNYARLHTEVVTYDIRETLTNLEAKLNPKDFVRVHRSAIVNIEQIREIRPWFHGYHLVVLHTGVEIRMSRYQREVAAKLGL